VTRRGLTLVELLVGLLLLGVVAAGCARWVLATASVAHRARARAERGATLRTVGALVARELGGVATDALVLAGDTLRYRARRGHGPACELAPSHLTLVRAAYRGWRWPAAGRDSVRVPVDSAAWRALALRAVREAPCPNGDGGLRLELAPAVGWLGVAGPRAVELVEWMELRAYESAGSWWLGARTLRPTDVVQPVAGPLAPRGFRPRLVARAPGDTALAVVLRPASVAGPHPLPDETLEVVVGLACGAAC
jgi:prepilin-type N-terminal cleavage/methylation domain-containing protein